MIIIVITIAIIIIIIVIVSITRIVIAISTSVQSTQHANPHRPRHALHTHVDLQENLECKASIKLQYSHLGTRLACVGQRGADGV